MCVCSSFVCKLGRQLSVSVAKLTYSGTFCSTRNRRAPATDYHSVLPPLLLVAAAWLCVLFLHLFGKFTHCDYFYTLPPPRFPSQVYASDWHQRMPGSFVERVGGVRACSEEDLYRCLCSSAALNKSNSSSTQNLMRKCVDRRMSLMTDPSRICG